MRVCVRLQRDEVRHGVQPREHVPRPRRLRGRWILCVRRGVRGRVLREEGGGLQHGSAAVRGGQRGGGLPVVPWESRWL